MRTWIILGSILIVQLQGAFAQDGAVAAERTKRSEPVAKPVEGIKGRLFFSNQERSVIDRVREGKSMPKTSGIRSSVIEFNGYIESSQGSRHVWINQKMLPQKAPLGKGHSLVVENSDAQTIVLRPGQRNTAMPVKE